MIIAYLKSKIRQLLFTLLSYLSFPLHLLWRHMEFFHGISDFDVCDDRKEWWIILYCLLQVHTRKCHPAMTGWASFPAINIVSVSTTRKLFAADTQEIKAYSAHYICIKSLYYIYHDFSMLKGNGNIVYIRFRDNANLKIFLDLVDLSTIIIFLGPHIIDIFLLAYFRLG